MSGVEPFFKAENKTRCAANVCFSQAFEFRVKNGYSHPPSQPCINKTWLMNFSGPQNRSLRHNPGLLVKAFFVIIILSKFD